MPELPSDLGRQVETALAEDIGRGDVTAALVPAAQRVRGRVITREAAVLCGQAWADETFRRLDPLVRLTWHAADGARLVADQVVLEIAGPARAVLTGERTALNFLQLLVRHRDGRAAPTSMRSPVPAATSSIRARPLPGLRTAQKYAVRCGGADNHRMGLFDQILIKENHIAAAGSITAAIAAARASAPRVAVEVEVESLQELAEALAAGPDIIMLDEFTLTDMRSAVALKNARRASVRLEASGSVSLETVRRDRGHRRGLRLSGCPHQARAGGGSFDAAGIQRRLARRAA